MDSVGADRVERRSRFAWLLLMMLTTSAGAGGPGRDAATQTFSFEGQVRFIELEGGFWGLMSREGEKYLPRGGVPIPLQRRGLAVTGRLRTLEGLVSYRMWGRPVEIVELQPATRE